MFNANIVSIILTYLPPYEQIKFQRVGKMWQLPENEVANKYFDLLAIKSHPGVPVIDAKTNAKYLDFSTLVSGMSRQFRFPPHEQNMCACLLSQMNICIEKINSSSINGTISMPNLVQLKLEQYCFSSWSSSESHSVNHLQVQWNEQGNDKWQNAFVVEWRSDEGMEETRCNIGSSFEVLCRKHYHLEVFVLACLFQLIVVAFSRDTVPNDWRSTLVATTFENKPLWFP